MKLFLDANILFTAAHNPGGKAALVLELAGKGHWEVATSSFAIEEARRNIAAKFPGALADLDTVLVSVEVVPTLLDQPCPIDLPEKDVPIFLSALDARCTHLLTGDLRDFGPFMNAPDLTSGILVQTVGQFLSRL